MAAPRVPAKVVLMNAGGLNSAHINPVYGSYFADPFVWKHQQTWYAIGTGAAEASGAVLGKLFPVLHSADFYQWQFAGHALLRPDPALGDTYWAPEVAYHEGRFYLYYSVGHEDRNHQLRVATSTSPQGPYEDLDIRLIDDPACPFAIDPHPFRDDDGQWYLFYARDFLDASGSHRAGTALAVTRLKTLTQADGPGHPILRARSDWQRFQNPRPMYGGVYDWHTLEGPFVKKRHGRYFCLYSGGRWETQSYGVDYGVASHVLGPYSDAGNEAGPRVVRTVPDRVLGPGHASIVSGPEGGDYLAYHAWDRKQTARQMFLDRLAWGPEGPRCEGPTWGPAFET